MNFPTLVARQINLHSFIQAISIATQVIQKCPHHSTDAVWKFHAEASQATASEELAQGSYVATRAG